MNLNIFLEITQMILAISLVGLILLQSRGTGLSATFGGAGFATSKRGVEKIVFYATIGVLVMVSLISLLLTIKN
jgi:protein translocase SecG subunit